MSENNSSTKNTHIIISDSTKDRYATFGLISWWKQEIVRNATVMVVGAGALGNEVLKNLALMGVGKIFLLDFDIVEYANLSRSILFRASDNGRKKAVVAAEAIRELNPDVKVQGFVGNVVHDLGLGVYRRMDIVIGCLDNREARLAVNQACWHLNKPWVDGAIQELLGMARVFWPNRGACYECTMTDEDYRIISERESCQLLANRSFIEGNVPTTPTISSIIAGIQTQEALKILHGLEVNCGQAIVFNGLNNEFFPTQYSEKEGCLSHEIYTDIIELQGATASNTTLKNLLDVVHKTFSKEASLLIPAFVTKATCSQCSGVRNIMRPLFQLNSLDVHCEKCDEPMRFELYEKVTGGESFMHFTLDKVGIPPLDILAARTDDWQFKFFELTGDKETFFKFQ